MFTLPFTDLLSNLPVLVQIIQTTHDQLDSVTVFLFTALQSNIDDSPGVGSENFSFPARVDPSYIPYL